MVDLIINRPQLDALELKLQLLHGGLVNQKLGLAARRAATHASKIGRQKIRSIYAISKGDFIGRWVRIRPDGACGAIMTVRGTRQYVGKYKAKQTKKGIFVSVKKGQGGIIARSFSNNGTFMQRTSPSRFPIKTLRGPAAPQLFENPEVMEEMSRAAIQMYEKRVEHELGRLIGG